MRTGLAFENRDRDEVGFLRASMSTVREVLLTPSEAFARMRQVGGWADPMLFLIVFGTIGSMFGLVWNSGMRSLLAASSMGGDLGEIATLNEASVVAFLFTPLFVLVFAAILAGIYHVLLALLGGAPFPFETTMRGVCFVWGSTALFNVVPICGALLGTIWFLVAMSIALREAQEVPMGRAGAAVLVPFVLACLCVTFAMFFAVAIPLAMTDVGFP